VTDHVYAKQRAIDRLRVADVAAHELEAGVSGDERDAAGVHARKQRVEHPDLMTCACERLGDMGPDEAGTAGD
jgi:hypothetical protein